MNNNVIQIKNRDIKFGSQYCAQESDIAFLLHIKCRTTSRRRVQRTAIFIAKRRLEGKDYFKKKLFMIYSRDFLAAVIFLLRPETSFISRPFCSLKFFLPLFYRTTRGGSPRGRSRRTPRSPQGHRTSRSSCE